MISDSAQYYDIFEDVSELFDLLTEEQRYKIVSKYYICLEALEEHNKDDSCDGKE